MSYVKTDAGLVQSYPSKIVNNLNADYHIKPHRILNMIQATHMGIHLKQQQFPQGTKGV